jgi:hypothetical protein
VRRTRAFAFAFAFADLCAGIPWSIYIKGAGLSSRKHLTGWPAPLTLTLPQGMKAWRDEDTEKEASPTMSSSAHEEDTFILHGRPPSRVSTRRVATRSETLLGGCSRGQRHRCLLYFSRMMHLLANAGPPPSYVEPLSSRCIKRFACMHGKSIHASVLHDCAQAACTRWLRA